MSAYATICYQTGRKKLYTNSTNTPQIIHISMYMTPQYPTYFACVNTHLVFFFWKSCCRFSLFFQCLNVITKCMQNTVRKMHIYHSNQPNNYCSQMQIAKNDINFDVRSKVWTGLLMQYYATILHIQSINDINYLPAKFGTQTTYNDCIALKTVFVAKFMSQNSTILCPCSNVWQICNGFI